MYLEFTEEQQALQRQLRQYFEDLVADVEDTPSDEPTYTRYIRQMGHDGWLGLGWPEEYGGMARGPIDQMIFVEESHWAGVPLPLLTLNSVGPTIMSLGTEEQKQRLLPGILKGEVHFSIGYTEPSAGTDLASLKTRAVRDGDEYVINGQKIFTSAIQYADYVWLAARTDPDAPKHKGLSVFIVPLDTPGFHWAPLPTIAGDITSSTFYEDVRVPAANLVGAENQGWKLITNQLNHERVAICPASGLLRSLSEVRRWAQGQRLGDGLALMDHEWVQISLARAHAKIEVLKLLNWKVAWASDKGLNPADASATKVYGTELALEVYRAPARGGRSGRVSGRRVPGGGPAGPAREPGPEPDHLHLRGRDERDSARHRRHDRLGDATGAALNLAGAAAGAGNPRRPTRDRDGTLSAVFERFADRVRQDHLGGLRDHCAGAAARRPALSVPGAQ